MTSTLLRKYLGIVLLITAAVFSTCSCSNNAGFDDPDPTINEGVIQTQDFIVASESTELGTKAKGSVILFGAEGVTERINIITWVEIDPNDWGGVSFYISQEWSVSGITSSYPKSATQDGESVVIWRTADQSAEYDKWIEIGADHTAYTPTGGGTGVVIIELDYIGKKTDSAKPFSVMVGVGSDDKDGIMIRHPDFKVIEVSP